MKSVLATLTALTILPTVAVTQGAVTVPGSQRYLMKSTTSGVEYQIDVALPSGYQSATKRYPVFYILDGNLVFGTLVDAYRTLRIDAAVPEMVLVGVGYPVDDPAVSTPDYNASRSRDYTPTPVEAIPGSGQGRAFLTFLKDELFPLIDGRYRTDPTDRGLGGHSFGGLFTNYALLTEPGLFRRYWIGSPSLWWNGQEIFATVAPARGRSPHAGGRAFLTVGALEADLMVPPMRRMAALLRQGFPALTVGSMVYPDETHLSVIGGAISRALRFLYARPTVPLTVAEAAGYAGRWVSASGETIVVTAAGTKVSLTMTPFGFPLVAILAAQERDHLFGTNFGMELMADRDQRGRVVRLRRQDMGVETVFERARGR